MWNGVPKTRYPIRLFKHVAGIKSSVNAPEILIILRFYG
jgi:hypothetical protein